MIRQGDWKLHLFHEEWSLDGGRQSVDSNNSIELYNLADDISETTNLASSNQAMRDKLLDDLLAWKESTNAQFAHEPNPAYGSKAAPEKKRKKK